MSGIATAVVGTAVVSGYFANEAAEDAADAQIEGSEAGIAENRRQFDLVQELLSPYTQAGVGSLTAQEDILGLNGPEAQQAAISSIESSPEFTSLIKQGEEAILQNASATGGLRGGNVQSALSEFRPELLSQLINDKFTRLGGITGLGQASAAGVGAAAQNTGALNASLFADIGAAGAGEALAKGQSASNVANSVGTLSTLKLLGAF